MVGLYYCGDHLVRAECALLLVRLVRISLQSARLLAWLYKSNPVSLQVTTAIAGWKWTTPWGDVTSGPSEPYKRKALDESRPFSRTRQRASGSPTLKLADVLHDVFCWINRPERPTEAFVVFSCLLALPAQSYKHNEKTTTARGVESDLSPLEVLRQRRIAGALHYCGESLSSLFQA